MFNYLEIIDGDVRNRGNVVQLAEGTTGVNIDYYGEDKIDCYQSVYLHTESLREWFKDTSRSYDGIVWTNYFHWDFDHDDLQQSFNDTKELVNRLQKFNPENIKVFFSGNKGFHVLYMSPEIEKFNGDIPSTVKSVCCSLASDLPTFDSKIYDKTRIFRSINSRHSVTGLYKVQLPTLELEINEILAWAKTQNEANMSYSKTTHEGIYKLMSENQVEITNSSSFNLEGILDGIANGFSEGNRNTGLASVAGLLHRRNLDDNFVNAMLTAINNRSSCPLPPSDIGNIVRSISRYAVDQTYTDPKAEDLKSIDQAGIEWSENFKKYGYCRFGERFKHIENRMKMCIPGDVIGIAAMSGIGKTTLSMEIGNNEAKEQDKKSLFISLEMSNSGIFFRAATICFPRNADYIPPEEVARKLKDDKSFFTGVCDEWKNIIIVDKGGLTIDQIVNYYNIASDRHEISNIVVDYAQNISNAEDIKYSMKMARGLKTIAKDLNTKMFVAMQCNKELQNPYAEIEKNHIEGAGAYFQACDYILGFWWDEKQKNRVHGKFLKNRWGDVYKFDMVRAGLKFHTEDYS